MKRSIEIINIFDDFKVDIKPLSIEDLNLTIALAMETGFFGNIEIMKFVVEKGCMDKSMANHILERSNLFTLCSLTREIWYLTLQNLSNMTKKLRKIVGGNPGDIKINHYKFTDLATPGLIWFLTNNLNSIDAEKYSFGLLEEYMPEATYKGKILSKKEYKKCIIETFDYLTNWYLNKNGLEGNYIDELPSNIFHNSKEKFYVMIQLIQTVDWAQYFKVVYEYNKVLEQLIKQSHYLGGLDPETIQNPLTTGIPAFIDIIRFPKFNKLNTMARLLEDVMINNKQFISSKHTKIIKKCFKDSMKEVVVENPEALNTEDLFKSLMNKMTMKISKYKEIVVNIELEYFDEYKEALIYEARNEIRKIVSSYKSSLIPDCYILVEGESDEICYDKFTSLMNNENLVITVIPCGSKQKVETRYRELIKEKHYIGSIVTILDADAQKEHENIKRINSIDILSEHFIYEEGCLEDIFGPKLIVKTLNVLYPEGRNISQGDLVGEGSIEKKIEKALWNKRIKFDKIALAKAISNNMKSKNKIPKTAQTIIDKTLELAKKSVELKPKERRIWTSKISNNQKVIKELEKLLDEDIN